MTELGWEPVQPGSGALGLHHTPASSLEGVKLREVDILEKAGGHVAEDRLTGQC